MARIYNPSKPLHSLKQLEFLLHTDRATLRSIVASAPSFYQPFDLKRPEKKKWRHIDNPSGELRRIQRLISRRILRHVPLPETLVGCVHGRSPTDHAKPHAGKSLVFTADIKDCFPSINAAKVKRAIKSSLRASDAVATLLTGLTVLDDHLPQGASTSPAIANLVLLPLHYDMQRIAERHALDITFYVDDIAASGDHVRDAIGEIVSAVQRNGFRLANSKSTVLPRHDTQPVVGIQVNRKRLSAGHSTLHHIRDMILATTAMKNVSPRRLRIIDGLIANVRQISRPQGNVLRQFRDHCLPPTPNMRLKKVHTGAYRPCPSFAEHRNT